ncbi:MAG TPA: protein kinase [Blastocatellia bacterium]|nr:protein kinase [Blastocatellia bacterium]
MLDPGRVLQGRYEIIQKIGEGGMGAVYLAKDRRLENAVALKETLFTDENLLRAFEREARLLAGLRHSALTKVSDHFTEGGSQYLVMDFISGDDLHTVLEKRRQRIPPLGEAKPFTQDEVLNWADQLLDALDYLHSHQPPIIHRDIKPQNLKITDRDHVILLDFGLAKGAASQDAQMTANKSIFGYTPTYAPIEQMQASGTGPPSDLYSLGATLYHLITGRTPPDALKRFAAVANGQPDPLVAPNVLNPLVSEAVADVLMWAMARNSNERPENASAMRKALRDARRGQVASGAQRTVTPPPQVPNYPATHVSQPQPSNPQPPAQSSWPQPSAQSSWPQQPVSPTASQPPAYSTRPQPPAQPSWPQPQIAVTQAQYPPPQPAQKSSKGLWIVIGVLTVAVVAVAIVLLANINNNDRRADSSNLVSKSANSSTGPNVPSVSANTSSTTKPDNSAIPSGPVGDPRIDETLDHYVAALGGREAIQSVSSRVVKGTLEMADQGVVGTVELYAKAPNKFAVIMNIPSVGTIRNGYNGTVGWAQESNLGLRRLEGAELSALKRDSEFYKELKLKELFSTLSFDGKESVDGREAYVITGIPPEGGSEKWYFDAKSGLLLRTDQNRESAQGVNASESYFDQYKTVDGINMPYRLRLTNGLLNSVIKIKEINHNVAINDAIFNMPNY